MQGQADPEGDLQLCDLGLDPVQAAGLVRGGRGLLRFLVGDLGDLLQYLVQVNRAHGMSMSPASAHVQGIALRRAIPGHVQAGGAGRSPDGAGDGLRTT